MTQAEINPPALYDAFVSYNHAKDKPVGAALQTVMQKLGKAWHQRRALRIFRDDTSLAATPELWPALEKTLSQTRYIILIASPEFARSKWCGMEVAYWLEHKSLDTLLIAVTDGDLRWDAAADDFVWDETTPLPPVLRGHFRAEPKWIDLRPFREAPNVRDPQFADAAADLSAAVHGLPKEDLLSQEVRQQKRALRLARGALAALMLLAAGAGWQWWSATIAKRSAEAAQQRAVVERDRAEANLATARGSADDLIFKIAAGLRNIQGMSVEQIRQILETARSVLDELQKSAPDDLVLQRRRAALLTEFSRTYSAAGNLTQARQSIEDALAIVRKLLIAEPNEARSTFNVAAALTQLATVLSGLDDTAGRLAAREEAVKLMRSLVEREPSNTDYQRELSATLNRAGSARFAAGDRAGGAGAYRESLTIMALAATPDASADIRYDYSYSLSNVASVKESDGDADGALRDQTEVLTIRRKLAAEHPSDLSYQSIVASTLRTLGRLQRNRGDRDAAFAHYGESVSIMRKLGATDNENRQWMAETATSIENLASLYLETRAGYNTATLLANQALDLRRRLVKVDPSNIGWQQDLSVALQRYGDTRDNLDDKPGALAAFEEAVVTTKKLFALDPGRPSRERDYSIVLARAGDIRRDTGDLAAARTAYEECVAIARRVSTGDPKNETWRIDVAIQLIRLGGVLLRTGDRAGGLTHFEEAYGIRRALAEAAPGRVDHQVSLALALYNISTASEPARAREVLQEAIRIVDAVAGKLPQSQVRIPAMLREVLTKLDTTAAK